MVAGYTPAMSHSTTNVGVKMRPSVAEKHVPADAAGLLGHTVAVHLSTYVTSTERGAQTAATALGEALAAAR